MTAVFFMSMKCPRHSVRFCTFCDTSYNSQKKSKSSKKVTETQRTFCIWPREKNK